uniref:Uncharacterized protein n=1 Tax=Solanum lycopersicum TaxID=4081 RepID=A0A3Q7IV24_SOLLC
MCQTVSCRDAREYPTFFFCSSLRRYQIVRSTSLGGTRFVLDHGRLLHIILQGPLVDLSPPPQILSVRSSGIGWGIFGTLERR